MKIFIIITIIAVFIRTYELTQYPLFHADEMAFGYAAYSYLKSGQDEFGRPMGVVWESVGDYKLTPTVYAAMPFVAVAGLSEFTTRLPSVLWGLSSAALLYILTRKYSQNKHIALISTLLLLSSPWHILFSRTSNEAILLLFLILFGFYAYGKASEDRSLQYIILTTIVLSFATVAYYAAFIYLPIVALTFYLLKKGWKNSKLFIVPVVAVFLTNIFFISTQPLSRVNQTSIFSSNIIQSQQQKLHSNQAPWVPTLVTRVLYNKPFLTAAQLSKNFFDHFTYRFLFAQGDSLIGRYSLPNMGPLFLWQLPFLLIGAVITLTSILHNRFCLFIWIALICAVIPNSLSTSGPITQRTLNMLPPLLIIIAIGLQRSYLHLKNYNNLHIWMMFILAPIIIYQLLFFINDLFIQMPHARPDLRQGYAKQTIQKINELAPQYSKTYVTDGGTYISHLFYNQTEPRIARSLMDSRQYTQANYILLPKTENVFFMNIDCPISGKPDILFVCKGENIPPSTKLLHVINHPNGKMARFFITFMDQPDLNTQPPVEQQDYGKEIKSP